MIDAKKFTETKTSIASQRLAFYADHLSKHKQDFLFIQTMIKIQGFFGTKSKKIRKKNLYPLDWLIEIKIVIFILVLKK